MQYRTLGRTGIKVSPYALGTLMFATSVGNSDPADSIRVLHKALDAASTSWTPPTPTPTRRRSSARA